MNKVTSPHRRVLLVAADGALSDFTFDIGAILARHRESALIAVLRESLRIATAASLPFVHEVDRISGIAREFLPADAALAQRRMTRRCEQRLQALATEFALETGIEHWDIARVPPVSTGSRWWAAMDTTDVVVVSSGQALGSRPRHGPRIGYMADDKNDEAQLVAQLLARKTGGTLVAFSAATLASDKRLANEDIHIMVLLRSALAVSHALSEILIKPDRYVVLLP